MALVAVRCLLFVPLPALGVGVDFGTAAGTAGSAAAGSGFRAVVGSIRGCGSAVLTVGRWRISHNITVGSGVPRVVDVVCVVVGNSAPPVRRIHRRERAQEPRIAPAIVATGPVATAPVSTAPIRAMPAIAAPTQAVPVSRAPGISRAGVIARTTRVTVVIHVDRRTGAPTGVSTAKS